MFANDISSPSYQLQATQPGGQDVQNSTNNNLLDEIVKLVEDLSRLH